MTTRVTPLVSAPRAAIMFPTLTPAQIARSAAHDVVRPIVRGAEPGERWLYCCPDDGFTEY